MNQKPRHPRLPVAKPKPPSERVEQAHTVQLLRSIGAHVYVLGNVRRKGDYPGTMQTPGLPDLYAILPGCTVGDTHQLSREHGHAVLTGTGYTTKPPQQLWVEMKRQGGRVRPEQKVFAERCVAAGVAHVTGTCDDVIAYLISGGWLCGALSAAAGVDLV